METNTLETSLEVLQKKGYNLLSQVFTKYEFMLLKNPIGEYWCPIIAMQEDEDKHIFDSLVSFAAMMRVNDDLSGYSDKQLEHEPNGVGTLTKNGVSEPLSLREACNKIIHASTIEIRLDHLDTHPIYPKYEEELCDKDDWQKYKNPIISLIGSQHGNDWAAELNLLNYVTCYQLAAT